MRDGLESSTASVTKSIDGDVLAVSSGRDFSRRSASAIRAWICDGDKTRVALLPTVVPSGAATFSSASLTDCDADGEALCGLGQGFRLCRVCAWAIWTKGNDVTIRSSRGAKDIFFIVLVLGLYVRLAGGRDKCG